MEVNLTNFGMWHRLDEITRGLDEKNEAKISRLIGQTIANFCISIKKNNKTRK